MTRYVSGLVCRIDPPDLSTRRKILRQQAQVLRLLVDEEALDFVADRFVNNVREMSGALHCLQTYQVMTGKRIGVAAARTVLSRLDRDCLRIVRIPDVELAVCKLFGLTPEQIKSSSRERTLTQPRMLAMYLARRLTQSAYSEIGRYFGGRNHATVMSAERKIARLIHGCISEAPRKGGRCQIAAHDHDGIAERRNDKPMRRREVGSRPEPARSRPGEQHDKQREAAKDQACSGSCHRAQTGTARGIGASMRSSPSARSAGSGGPEPWLRRGRSSGSSR